MKIGFVLKDLHGYSAHVQPFVIAGKEQEFIVFHLDKYFGNKKLVYTIKDKVKFVELSHKYKLNKLLLKYNLDYLVFFNPGNLFEQALILICSEVGIKTIYFQHGVNPNYSRIGLTRKSHIDWTNYLLILSKYTFFYIIILISVIRANKLKYYKYLISRTIHLLKMDKNSISRNYGTIENHTDICFVYNNSDKDLLQKHLKINYNSIIVTGYPFIEHDNNEITSNRKYVLYISSALRASKVINISLDEELLLYKNLNSEIEKTDFKLIVKLHPRDDYQAFREYFKHYDGLQILWENNIANLTKNAEIVIGDLSSALFYAVKYYKPIILLTYPFLQDYAFDLYEWSIGKKLKIDELASYLKKCKYNEIVSDETYKHFLCKFLSYDGYSSYAKFFRNLNA